MKYSWHRFRKWLKPKQNQAEYDRLAAELATLLELEDKNYLRVYFADESGFCLTPTVPYGWQPIGKQEGIVPQNSKRRNVFGLLGRDNDFFGYDTYGSMDAIKLCTYLDEFSNKITQKTVVVLDNAPFHHNRIIKEKIQEWQEKDLMIWFLPTYSPHLNKIETLWRKIKHEWLKPYHYVDWKTLNEALDSIFANIGDKYRINYT